ncbi:MFS transporter [Exiguobacterium undae]|uniref:MFS transporter n=1 Tax=Exiguobacterium undae TaxID=169177 RepID=A0ABX2V4W8_9BACL|nr:MFS transporter [Exiguobacterium undae]OAN10117.1 hypothetical protein A3783_15245 [Exiguobacterium undae]
MSKEFKLFYISNIISVLGNSVSYIAVYWFSAQILNPFQLSLMIASVFLMRFLFSTFGGPIIDHYDGFKLLKISISLRVILLFTVYLAIFKEEYTITFLVLLVLCQTAIQIVASNASFKLVKIIVEDEMLLKANSYLNTLDRIGSLVGLLLGGIFIANFSIQNIIFFEAVAHVFALLLIINLKSNKESDEIDNNVKSFEYFKSLKIGFRYLSKDKALLKILIAAILANLIITPSNTLLAPFVERVLGRGAEWFSYIQIATVVGGILASLYYAKSSLMKNIKLEHMFYISIMLQGIFMIGLSYFENIVLSVLMFTLLGAALSLFGIPFATMLQQNTPENLLGRVRSSMVALSTLSSTFFYFLSGYMTKFVSVKLVFLSFSITGFIFVTLLTFIAFSKKKVTMREENLKGEVSQTKVGK